MRLEFETISSASPFQDAAIFLQQKNSDCLLVVADNRLIGVISRRNFLGVTIDLLQDRDEFKIDDMDEGTEIGTLYEDDLGDIFVDKLETED